MSSRRSCMLRTSLRVRNIYLNVFSREIYMIDTTRELELPRARRIASNSDWQMYVRISNTRPFEEDAAVLDVLFDFLKRETET